MDLHAIWGDFSLLKPSVPGISSWFTETLTKNKWMIVSICETVCTNLLNLCVQRFNVFKCLLIIWFHSCKCFINAIIHMPRISMLVFQYHFLHCILLVSPKCHLLILCEWYNAYHIFFFFFLTAGCVYRHPVETTQV